MPILAKASLEQGPGPSGAFQNHVKPLAAGKDYSRADK